MENARLRGRSRRGDAGGADEDGAAGAGDHDDHPAVDGAAAADGGSTAGGNGGNGNDADLDYVWSHGVPKGSGFICNYCHKKREGGGATRLREHLAGIIGNVKPCEKVPKDVRKRMNECRLLGKEIRRENKERRERVEKEIARRANARVDEVTVHDYVEVLSEEEELQVAIRRSLDDLNMRDATTSRAGGASGSRSGSTGTSRVAGHQRRIDRVFRSMTSSNRRGGFDIDLARSRAPIQPRIDVAFNRGDLRDKLGKAWAKFFHANDIAGRKANCPYFKAAVLLTQQLGEGVPCPTGEAIDGQYLESNYDELQKNMEGFKKDWDQYKVSLMCDSWTGPTGDSIINFMVYCNQKMFFHKTVNATGKIQNATFLYNTIKKVVVEEIGEDRVMQIVTDNGSNYKKACKELIMDYPKIIWQPCAAHTVNLLLKNIGQFSSVDRVVCSAQRICKFFYNHNRLHAEMKRRISGELYRWNATRFGTVFVFLQSFRDREDKFREWMGSVEWRNSDYNRDPEYKYADKCLSSRQWWENVKFVLNLVEPIYILLRFADSQRIGTVSGFMPRVMATRNLLEAHLSRHPKLLKNVLGLLDERVKNMCKDTLMLAAGVLDPKGHYEYDTSSNPEYLMELALVIEKIADSPESAVRAISQFQDFKSNSGIFGTTTSRLAALAQDVTPTNWWSIYGGDTKELQKYALMIVSQCVSSSGCERNWSTFSLVHTKLRNRLSYEKLHKLVFVHYNLRLAVQQLENDQRERERVADPVGAMIDVALFDHSNPITEWFNSSMAESPPILDEEDGQPSRALRREVWEASLAQKRKRAAAKGNRNDASEDEFEESESESDGTSERTQYLYEMEVNNPSDDDLHDDGEGEEYDVSEPIGEAGEDNAPRPRRTCRKKQQVENQDTTCHLVEDGGEVRGDEPLELADVDNESRPMRACRQNTVNVRTLLGCRK